MNKRNWTAFLTAATIVALVGCGKKQKSVDTGPAKERISAPAPTPIDQTTVGEVTGKISFDGAKPRQQRIIMDQDPACTEKRHSPVFAEDGGVNDNGTLPNVFVYVKAGAEKYTFAPPASVAVLDQNGCMYQPHVLGIMAGQTLKIVSSDATTHNIHPMPKDNREWNMSQSAGRRAHRTEVRAAGNHGPGKVQPAPLDARVDRSDLQPILCRSGSDGTFTIKGLPPGDYTIEAWTATFGTQEQNVTVGAKETKTVDFKFQAP